MRWLADENFNGHIVDGLRRRKPSIDVLRAQDTEVAGRDDTTVLAWSGAAARVLLTHDAATMIAAAHERIGLGLPLAGVFVCATRLSIAVAIEDLLMVDDYSEPVEWKDQIVFLPLRR